ncbi:MAG: hypothetical protein BroJett039_05250 [Chloroflexota bacterium]|nr:MAG: hypothetical protein BroJett039_05250 [Chloroflexota bacterium]
MKWFDARQETLRQNTPAIILLVAAALLAATLVYQVPNAARIDVGSGSDTPFVQSFSFRENLPDGGDARWSAGQGEIRFWGVGAQDGLLKLRALTPEQNRATGIQILVNGQPRGALQSAPGWNEITLPLARDDIGWRGDLIIKIVSATFTAPPDTRKLGVQVDDAQFSGVGAPALPPLRVLIFTPLATLLAFAIGAGWSGARWGGWLAASATLLACALGLTTARVATAYFMAPLFFAALFLFGGARAFAAGLRRLTRVLPAPALSNRALRFLFLSMCAALAFRLIFASSPGFSVDTQDYMVWSYKTVTYGLGAMYASFNGLWLSDQSPGLNYILHAMGLLYRDIFAPDFLYPAVAGDPALRGLSDNPAFLADPTQRLLLRLPMLLADALTGALIFCVARKYVADQFAWLCALAYWFNPAVLWNGTFWGQMDALHALLVLVSFLLIVFARRVGWAFFILGIAAFTKPQAMIFGPLLLLAAHKTFGISENPKGFKGVARALLFGALGAGLLLLPVLLTGGAQGLLAYFGDTVGHHPILTANAHNLWWFLYPDKIDLQDTMALWPGAPLSFRAFSLLLFGAFYALTLWRAWRAPLEEFFELGAFVAFAFFMLPTEIHENYGYALLPLLATAMTRVNRLLAFYIALSATMTWNYALHDPTLFERFQLREPAAQWALPRRVNAIFNLIIFGAWSVYILARARLSRAKTPTPANNL